ncbi:FAD-dependent oxidoreductase [Nocardioides sp. R1-1]|uniref:FAD-dependent oxidoreductase n=1 Tax=Nocardioides sp. R1-1 TaxID=3383502 RepID=UPI0038D0C67A
MDRTADVVVLGHGAAGCAAAIAAHDAGARVVLVDKMPAGLEGGSTRVSGGAWWEPSGPERAAVYLRSLCGDRPLPEPVVRAWAEECARNTAWMRDAVGAEVGTVPGTLDRGIAGTVVEVPPEFPELEGSDAVTGWRAVGGALGRSRLLTALTAAVAARDITVLLATRAERLTQDADGSVVGVHVRDDGGASTIHARGGVVLATGGFEGDAGMVRDYLRLPHSVTWGSPHNTGDGHRMAQKAGADLWHMDNMTSIEGFGVPGFPSGFYARFSFRKGFVYVDGDGRRCVDELPRTGHGHARVHGAYEHVPARRLHAVFDEATRLSGPISPNAAMLPVGWNVLVEGYEWSWDNSVEVEKGWLHRADTLEELAPLIGVDPALLVASVARYNAACASGVDEQFHRDPATLVPLGDGPYYAFTSAPMLAWSNGGPRRNQHAEVLDPFGATIPGLYAAGGVSTTYSWCKDGGMHIADALAFGRISGRRAAARAVSARSRG